MMKISPILLTAAGIAVIGAFWAGRLSVSGAENPAESSAATSKVRDRAAVSDRAPGRMAGRDQQAAARRAAGPEAAAASMFGIIDEPDPLSRTQAWLNFVNSLSASEFENVVAQFRDAGLTNGNMSEYALLLSAWAKADPLSALEYAEANTGNAFARNTILETWSQSDAQGAIAWARQHHEGDGPNPWMVGVIKGLAKNDTMLADQLMREMPSSRERGEALGAMLPVILQQQGAAGARTWVEGMDDERLRNGAAQILSDKLARTDPAGTAAWLNQMGGDAAKERLDDVMNVWSKTDRNAAVAYYNTLPPGENRSTALRGLTNQLAEENPQAAARFLDQHAKDANDWVYTQFVWRSSGSDPALAANYIGRIADSGQQERMYDRMLNRWLDSDYHGALDWMVNNDLPPKIVKKMNKRLTDMQGQQK